MHFMHSHAPAGNHRGGGEIAEPIASWEKVEQEATKEPGRREALKEYALKKPEKQPKVRGRPIRLGGQVWIKF